MGRHAAGRLALIWMLPAVAAAAIAPGTYFTHHDWELACDNTGTCRAAGYAPDGDDAPVSLKLERAAGPGAPVAMQVRIGFYDDAPFAADEAAALTLWVDGVATGRIALDADAVGTLSRAQVDAVLPRLAGDGTVAFMADDGRRWALSPRGSTAVLLKMDDVQGRVGTPGALIRRGTRDEATVPVPVPRPVVRVAALPATEPAVVQAINDSEKLRDALDAALGPDDDCFDLLDPDAEVVPLEVVRLTDAKVLVSHRCWLAAYNAGSGYWVIDDEPPWNPVVVTTAGTGFDAGTITASHKGRGLGDCWSEDAWSWDGAAFVKTREASTGLCRLVAPGGAWDLPVLELDVVPAAAE